MASEKYILVRPPQLPELQTIGQGVYLVGYDQQTDRTVKVNVQSIGGGEQAPDLIWRADTEYNSDSIVEFGLRLWKSLVDNNVGNIPMEGDNWTEVARASAATTSIPNWAAGVYTHSPTLVLRNNAIYRLTRPVPFESTDFEAEAAAAIPVWTKVSGGGGGHTFEDSTGNVLPTRNVAKAGAGIEFEDDDVGEKTVIKAAIFSEPIAFVNGSMTFDKNKYIQSHQITATFQFTKSAGTHYSGAMIEACLVADGVTGHKPTFSADFNIQYDNWDNTNGAKNLVRMRYLPEGILTEIRKI